MSDVKHSVSQAAPGASAAPGPVAGIVAEYRTPQELIAAARVVRDAGYRRWDTFAPFPVHGIDGAMGIQPTRLPFLVTAAGITGFTVAVLLQWYTNAYDYPWLISGKPMWSIPANVPVMFELTVLLSALTTLVGMLMMNDLPKPWHPLDHLERFARVTDDRFFLWIEARDESYDADATRALLAGTHPEFLDVVHEDQSTSDKLPRFVGYVLLIVAVAGVVPFALVASARQTKGREPRLHLVFDMDSQPKFKTQKANPFFADGRSMRDPVPGTVAWNHLDDDDHLHRGRVDGGFALTLPPQIPVTDATMARGKQRFDIYCAPCHGVNGEGAGMVAQRADALAQGTWVPPSNIKQDYLREQPIGQLFDSISNGVRNMPGYASQISVEDRWAILLYVRALQRSDKATIEDVPPEQRGSITN